MKTSFWSFALSLICVSSISSEALAAESAKFEIKVAAGPQVRTGVPVRVDVAVPVALKDATQASIQLKSGKTIVAQATAPSLLSKPLQVGAGEVHRQLCFIVDKLDADQTIEGVAIVTADASKSSDQFRWQDHDGKFVDLEVGDRPVLRYMYEALDESTPDRRGETYKVYHHVFDPSGKLLVTKGPGGKFPHHRGLYFGFNKITYDGKKKADVWHCSGKSFQSHDGFTASEVGPVLGRHSVKVGWHGQDGEVFAEENREMTVYRQPEADGKPVGTLIEFASILRTTGGDIQLNGDPQHSGFHFRAPNEVAEKTAGQTYYIRPEGVGKPGDYRNWPDKKDQVNFPWKGMSFVFGDQRYTAANLDRPENPKESRFSERDYGRFGSYFEYKLTKDNPLKLDYRIWLQPGEMTVAQIDAMAKDFTNPPIVTANKQ